MSGKLPRLLLIAAAVQALALSAVAAPAASEDEINRLLAERGLIGRLEQVGVTVRDRTAELVVNAMGLMGVPYRRGGNDADTGFDCSGFVRSVYEQSIGLLLPRKASDQAAATEKIGRKDLQPGDLVFFNTMRRAFSHVGIYVGDGKFIHSPRSGGKVRVEDMQESYWQKRFNGARRVAPEAQAGNAQAAALQAAAAEIQATPTPR